MQIRLTREYYKENEFIYDKSRVDFKSGLTVLIGCNGSGKSTMLFQIKNHCDSKRIPVLNFDNLKQGGSNSLQSAGFYGDMDFLTEGLISSEGEIINMNLGKFASKMGGFVAGHLDSNRLVFLLDAIDSGLSIDYVLELKKYLFKTVIEDCASKGIEVYIVVSANEYELARGEQCLDVSSCQYVDITSYEDYRNVVLETRKKKNIRYGWKEFMLS